MDSAIQTALRDALPVRVIVCEGRMRDPDDMEADASRVEKRVLDPCRGLLPHTIGKPDNARSPGARFPPLR